MDRGTVSWYTSVISGILLCAFMLLYPHPRFEDRVALIGDTYDYQTIAVNLAEKKVFPVSGMLLPDSAYHFRLVQDYPGAYTAERLRVEASPCTTYYRNPLYPVFCALVYKASGVRPALLFQLQLVLLILALCTIPFVGTMLAGRRGFFAGAISSVMIFFLTRQYAWEVQTQALVLPYTIGLWWILVRYLRRYDLRSAIIIGLYLAVGLLLKNFFIPVVLVVCCYRLIQSRNPRSLLLPLIIVMAILPYTLYINHQRSSSQSFVWITDQGSDVLIASNNDQAKDGDWHPEGVNLTAFYQQSDIKTKPISKQVIMYICEHPTKSLINMSEKIRLGLLSRWPPVLFLIMLVGVSIASWFKDRWRWLAVIAMFVLMLILGVLYFYRRDTFYDAQRAVNSFITGSGLLLLLFPICYLLLRRLQSYTVGRHAASWILVVSFLSLNMIFYGSDRIVGMIDFLWMFYAVLFGFDLIDGVTE